MLFQEFFEKIQKFVVSTSLFDFARTTRGSRTRDETNQFVSLSQAAESDDN
jgi:hypothetical protein